MSKNIKTMSKSRLSIRTISYTAMLTAVCALANIYTAFFGAGGAFAVSFSYIPCFISGAFFGPLAGFMTGFLGDLIGAVVAPKGDINPLILVASGLLGLIPGVVFWLSKKTFGKNINLTIPTIVSFVLMLLICTNLNTLALYLFYFKANGRTLKAVFLMRLPKQLIIWAINLIICIIIVKPVAKLLKL